MTLNNWMMKFHYSILYIMVSLFFSSVFFIHTSGIATNILPRSRLKEIDFTPSIRYTAACLGSPLSVKNCIYIPWLKVIIIVVARLYYKYTNNKANKYIFYFMRSLERFLSNHITAALYGKIMIENNDLSKQQNIRFCNQKYVSVYRGIRVRHTSGKYVLRWFAVFPYIFLEIRFKDFEKKEERNTQ